MESPSSTSERCPQMDFLAYPGDGPMPEPFLAKCFFGTGGRGRENGRKETPREREDTDIRHLRVIKNIGSGARLPDFEPQL